MLVAAAENFLGRDTAAAIEAVHGDLPETCAIEGAESIVDCAKATRVLSWEPAHSWRDAEDASVAGPAFV